jgi:murein DD-endopeptidase MepM/ murein hydrolase activator NlpD
MNTGSQRLQRAIAGSASGVAIARVLLTLTMAVAGAGVLAADASNAGGAARTRAGYSWPLKPFDQPHPVRAVFGDPRTTFLHPRNGDVLAGSGIFSFHDGVDIDAPDGTRVYPVVSGVVRSVEARRDEGASVVVQAPDGRAFAYTHIAPAVRVGQGVTARLTVLGRIDNSALELHFSEFSPGGRVVDPLLPGHLTPYADTTKPVVGALVLRPYGRSGAVRPFEVSGRVALVVEAYDLPMPVGREAFRVTHFARDRFAVAPAAMTWSMSTLESRRSVPDTRAFDFRRGLPPAASFWSVFARGTYQNRAPIVPRYHQQMPGRYLFWLTSSLDTRSLRDGVYVVKVAAVDARGNKGSLSTRIEIRNHDPLPR